MAREHDASKRKPLHHGGKWLLATNTQNAGFDVWRRWGISAETFYDKVS